MMRLTMLHRPSRNAAAQLPLHRADPCQTPAHFSMSASTGVRATLEAPLMTRLPLCLLQVVLLHTYQSLNDLEALPTQQGWLHRHRTWSHQSTKSRHKIDAYRQHLASIHRASSLTINGEGLHIQGGAARSQLLSLLLSGCTRSLLGIAGIRRWLSRMRDSSREGEGQKAPNTLPKSPSAGEPAAAKTSSSPELTKSQPAPGAGI